MATESKSGKSMLPVIIVMAVLSIGIGTGIGMFMSGRVAPADKHKKSSNSEGSEEKKAPESVKAESAKPSESLQAGRVLLVNRKFNFVVMNVGLKQGLKAGDQFTVLDGEAKVAKVEVEKLYDDFAAAKILEQFGDRALLKEGNLVTRAS